MLNVQDQSTESTPTGRMQPGKPDPFASKRSDGMTSQQASSMKAIHGAFAQGLTQRLTAQLGTSVEASLVSVDQVSFGEQLQRIEGASYLGAIQVPSPSATVLFELDLATTYPIIDLLLGGLGKGEPPQRDITEIEDLVFQTAVGILCQELEAAWKDVVDLTCTPGERQSRTKLTKLLPPDERMLIVNFDLQVMERRGTLVLAIPSVLSGTLLRRVSEQALVRRNQPNPDVVAARRRLLEDCTFEIEVRLPETPVSLQLLLELEPGQIVKVAHRVEDPALVTVGDEVWFSARPVRARNVRGALIDADLLPPSPPSKESL